MIEKYIKFPRIRHMREDNDIKQQTLADYLGCRQSTYANYELGNREIPLDIIIKLARFYNTSTDYLLGLTDCIEPYAKSKK
ncbi:MAG: helix-turn-helix transcriptional regulator [Selenomonadaceae bacterium]|nr:helix-turn-helix transcriptional regulator [Selenomonadaceae bacterium]